MEMVCSHVTTFVVFLLLTYQICNVQASLNGKALGKDVEIVNDRMRDTFNWTTEVAPQERSNETYFTEASLSNAPRNKVTKTQIKWNDTCSKKQNFRQGAESFLNYLLQMQSCDALDGIRKRMPDICTKRTFAYTEYYDVAYLKFCDEDLYRVVCQKHNVFPASTLDSVSNAPNLTQLTSSHRQTQLDYQSNTPVKKRVDNFFRNNEDQKMIETACGSVEDFLASFDKNELYSHVNKYLSANLDVSDFSVADLLKDENSRIPVVMYSEWYFPIIPFCKAFTCGTSYERYTEDEVSVYDCMPQNCKGMIVFSIIFDAILAVLTIVANGLVLGVAARTKIMRNIPGYFKISLALADLGVGVFVLPSCIFTTYTMYIGPLPFRYPGQRPDLTDYISRPLANFIGFFVVLSFAISVYTMAVASIDRYLAITKPFQYRQGRYLTKKRCVFAFALIWLIGFFVAIYPVFSTEPYGLSAFNLILSAGVSSSIVYAFALFVPLLAVWSLNGAMLKQVCADREKRSSIRATSVINSGTMQHSVKRENECSQLPLPGSRPEVENSPEKRPELRKDESENEKGDHATQPQKIPVARNTSTSSVGYHKNEKRSSGPVYEGIIERMKRKRSKKTGSAFQRKEISRQPSIPCSAASVERRLARTLAIMIGAFTLALMPNIATMVAYVVLSGDTSPVTSVRLASTFYIASRILLSNSFWNCIIYSIRNRHFRRAMWAIFLCKKEKIDRKLRQSVTISQWKRRSAKGSSSGSSVNDKQPLSKTNSTSSTAAGYQNQDHRRSTMMWSLSSTSPCPSRKGSSTILRVDKSPIGRSVSCNEAGAKQGILKKPVGRCESAPGPNEAKFIVPTVTVDTIDENTNVIV